VRCVSNKNGVSSHVEGDFSGRHGRRRPQEIAKPHVAQQLFVNMIDRVDRGRGSKLRYIHMHTQRPDSEGHGDQLDDGLGCLNGVGVHGRHRLEIPHDAARQTGRPACGTGRLDRQAVCLLRSVASTMLTAKARVPKTATRGNALAVFGSISGSSALATVTDCSDSVGTLAVACC